MKPTVQQILMSKKVATRFLKQASQEGRTLTVFFSSGTSKTAFINQVRTQEPSISVTEGFDQATFISLRKESMDLVESLAETKGLDWTDI